MSRGAFSVACSKPSGIGIPIPKLREASARSTDTRGASHYQTHTTTHGQSNGFAQLLIDNSSLKNDEAMPEPAFHSQ